MNEFKVLLTQEAQIDIQELSTPVQNRILEKLTWMGANAELLRHQPLKGKQWKGTYKYRVGDYRILYHLERESSQLLVLKVGHRRDIYSP